MNPRLEKLRQEREKLAEKLTSLTARLKALDEQILKLENTDIVCLLYTSPSPRDRTRSRMPSSA